MRVFHQEGALQNTIAGIVSCSGTGLHNGRPCAVVLHPAAAGTGIVFKAAKRSQAGIPAVVGSVSATANRVVLNQGDSAVDTVEHLLAALYALSVDNCLIEVEGGEVPALDGSASGFLELIDEAGVVPQDRPRSLYSLAEPLWIDEGERYIIALPSDGFRISYSVNFKHPSIGAQSFHFGGLAGEFRSDIAPARTFGFEADAAYYASRNLALGSGPDNSLVFLKNGGVSGPLRFPDECVRHKILDLLGDFALTGRRVNVHLICHRGGHSLHLAFVRKLVARLSGRAAEERWSASRKEEYGRLCRRIGLAR